LSVNRPSCCEFSAGDPCAAAPLRAAPLVTRWLRRAGGTRPACALVGLWPAHPIAWPRHGLWPAAPSAAAPACHAPPSCVPAVEVQGGTLAVSASRSWHRSAAPEVDWPPAAKRHRQTTRHARELPLAIRRAPGVRRRRGECGHRTPYMSREQVRTQKSFGARIKCPCVKTLGGLLCELWPIKDQ
jgi:hypothetical protein